MSNIKKIALISIIAVFLGLFFWQTWQIQKLKTAVFGGDKISASVGNGSSSISKSASEKTAKLGDVVPEEFIRYSVKEKGEDYLLFELPSSTSGKVKNVSGLTKIYQVNESDLSDRNWPTETHPSINFSDLKVGDDVFVSVLMSDFESFQKGNAIDAKEIYLISKNTSSSN